MEQYNKIVLEASEGMHYTTSQGENGELIVRLVPNVPATSQDSETCSQGETVEKTTDKAKYFTKITADDRDKVKKWLAVQEAATDEEGIFLRTVKKAVQKINYDFWIANLEPSVADGKIYYAKGHFVGAGFSYKEYEKMAREYAPERGSRLAKLHELFIWYALRIVNGLWTLDYVCKDSSSAGNYRNAPNASMRMETTGARTCGGYSDGQGNTSKIVTIEDILSSFALVGGYCYDSGDYNPVTSIDNTKGACNILYNGSGVLVLTK